MALQRYENSVLKQTFQLIQLLTFSMTKAYFNRKYEKERVSKN